MPAISPLLRRHARRIFAAWLLCLPFVLGALGVLALPGLARLEGWLHDSRLALTAPGGVDPRVVIVDIDEASLARLGQWPWPRQTVAALVDTLAGHYRVSAIGFDAVFAEPEHRASNDWLPTLGARFPALLPELRQLAAGDDHDRRLADSVRRAPVVLGYYFDTSDGAARHGGQLPEPVFEQALANGVAPVAAGGFGANLPQLQQAAGHAGHFNALADADGVNRRLPALLAYRGQLYDSLSLAMLRRLAGDMPLLPEFDAGGRMDAVSIGDWRLPLGADGSLLIPYRGARGSFPYISAERVLAREVTPAELAGRIVLVGASAPGLMDLRATPLSAVYPGVEIHANVIAAALDKRLYRQPDNAPAEALLLLVLGGTLALLLPLLSPLKAALASTLLAALLVGTNLAAWQYRQLALPLAAPLTLIVLLYLLNASWGYFSEARKRRELSGAFGSYVPPALVAKMADAPQRFLAQMQGEHRVMSVLFSDVRDFTRISEGLPATELSALMNRYLSAQTAHVQAASGTVDKYIGDAIMAFWGAPLADAEHARHAVGAALAMAGGMAALNDAFAARGWPPLAIGVGINSGGMNVGNMGSDFRRAYTVMGDAVNLAARLEGLTKVYGVPILCGPDTRAACPDMIWREVDRMRVKGKREAVSAWQPLPEGSQAAAGLTEWQAALEAYRARDFAGAQQRLQALAAAAPDDGLYPYYLARCAHYLHHPPAADWDGVHEHSEK
ncbi:CHASE2 domain-containing protein [Crenobacter intestini]|uniref:Adenylate/guanylate cyclase domain-containing protein n=1 Tax=Crenobacter intestini TaxID=2563443 RepID=A0A4T0UTN7_9NEIS|nr:adenylate/guanylate cyclase domain-containing protein [Crenobacter intestini]TIC82322.1 adenylate/guanylate cyclase domain-containing protein [Crenobacter intestini]